MTSASARTKPAVREQRDCISRAGAGLRNRPILTGRLTMIVILLMFITVIK